MYLNLNESGKTNSLNKLGKNSKVFATWKTMGISTSYRYTDVSMTSTFLGIKRFYILFTKGDLKLYTFLSILYL